MKHFTDEGQHSLHWQRHANFNSGDTKVDLSQFSSSGGVAASIFDITGLSVERAAAGAAGTKAAPIFQSLNLGRMSVSTH
jgi:hypothetical protein